MNRSNIEQSFFWLLKKRRNANWRYFFENQFLNVNHGVGGGQGGVLPGVHFINILQQLFRTKVFCTAFLKLQFVFVIFCPKNTSVKTAQKMLVKLTAGDLSEWPECFGFDRWTDNNFIKSEDGNREWNRRQSEEPEQCSFGANFYKSILSPKSCTIFENKKLCYKMV